MKKPKWIGTLILILGVGLVFWGFGIKADNKELKNKKMTKHISAEEYRDVISDKKVWNIDVREEYEFEEARINDAILAPSTRFYEIFDRLGIEKSDKIALYCRSGNRSAVIAKELERKGYENLFNLKLGLHEWKAMGFHLEGKSKKIVIK